MAGTDVPGKALQLIGYKAQRFEPPSRSFGAGAQGLLSNGILGALDCLPKQADILKGALDTVEWCALVGHDAGIVSMPRAGEVKPAKENARRACTRGR